MIIKSPKAMANTAQQVISGNKKKPSPAANKIPALLNATRCSVTIDIPNHTFVKKKGIIQFPIIYLVPTIGHQYTSPVGVKVISGFGPEAAANTSLSLNNWRGVNPVLNAICTSS